MAFALGQIVGAVLSLIIAAPLVIFFYVLTK